MALPNPTIKQYQQLQAQVLRIAGLSLLAFYLENSPSIRQDIGFKNLYEIKLYNSYYQCF